MCKDPALGEMSTGEIATVVHTLHERLEDVDPVVLNPADEVYFSPNEAANFILDCFLGGEEGDRDCIEEACDNFLGQIESGLSREAEVVLERVRKPFDTWKLDESAFRDIKTTIRRIFSQWVNVNPENETHINSILNVMGFNYCGGQLLLMPSTFFLAFASQNLNLDLKEVSLKGGTALPPGLEPSSLEFGIPSLKNYLDYLHLYSRELEFLLLLRDSESFDYKVPEIIKLFEDHPAVSIPFPDGVDPMSIEDLSRSMELILNSRDELQRRIQASYNDVVRRIYELFENSEAEKIIDLITYQMLTRVPSDLSQINQRFADWDTGFLDRSLPLSLYGFSFEDGILFWNPSIMVAAMSGNAEVREALIRSIYDGEDEDDGEILSDRQNYGEPLIKNLVRFFTLAVEYFDTLFRDTTPSEVEQVRALEVRFVLQVLNNLSVLPLNADRSEAKTNFVSGIESWINELLEDENAEIADNTTIDPEDFDSDTISLREQMALEFINDAFRRGCAGMGESRWIFGIISDAINSEGYQGLEAANKEQFLRSAGFQQSDTGVVFNSVVPFLIMIGFDYDSIIENIDTGNDVEELLTTAILLEDSRAMPRVERYQEYSDFLLTKIRSTS
jgi:hypothetical protein